MARQSSNKPQCGRTLTLTPLLHRGTGEVSTGDAHTQVPVTSRQVTQLDDMLTAAVELQRAHLSLSSRSRKRRPHVQDGDVPMSEMEWGSQGVHGRESRQV